MNLYQWSSKIESAQQVPGDRTPATPIRQGRSAPGGMIAAFVLIGFIVLAIAWLT